jgi:hypothetical protein
MQQKYNNFCAQYLWRERGKCPKHHAMKGYKWNGEVSE